MLDENTRKVVNAISRHGIIRGRHLKRMACIENNETFFGIIKELTTRGFIHLERGQLNESDEAIMDSYIAPLTKFTGLISIAR